ncbi:MAG: SMC family ATPase, partial [Ruminococcus sp.]|nr:SMC family ATPase [Ruminococcus sp.]
DSEKLLSELERSHGELLGQIGELLGQTKDKQKPDMDALQKQLLEIREKHRSTLKERDEALQCSGSCTDALKRLKAELGKNERLQSELAMKQPISMTANGSHNQKQKITLETYVQMEYFDRILELANIRLLTMTNGQYELVRSSRGKGQAKTGLEIDVTDHFSASTRNIRSLSGGETFMASLALALGFSDEIQRCSGGIRIDSMFVDEGFGSLDDESLDQAVKTLSTLAENSGLVGIISHVPELKEKLDKKIIVRKDRTNGSTVEIIS